MWHDTDWGQHCTDSKAHVQAMIEKTKTELAVLEKKIDEKNVLQNALVVMQAVQRGYIAGAIVRMRANIVDDADEE